MIYLNNNFTDFQSCISGGHAVFYIIMDNIVSHDFQFPLSMFSFQDITLVC